MVFYQKGAWMLRVIVAVVLASVVQFSWGFAFYGALGGLEYTTSRATDEAAVTEAIQSALPESGTYFVPACPGMNASEEATQAFEKRAALMQIQYTKDGFSKAQMPFVMGAGFGYTVLITFLAAWLLRAALPGLPTYFGRVGFVFGVGLFAAVARLSDVIWFHHHWLFEVGQILFIAVAWLLAGVVLGAIIRPAKQNALAATTHPSLAA
jgi:hypothetical protein